MREIPALTFFDGISSHTANSSHTRQVYVKNKLKYESCHACHPRVTKLVICSYLTCGTYRGPLRKTLPRRTDFSGAFIASYTCPHGTSPPLSLTFNYLFSSIVIFPRFPNHSAAAFFSPTFVSLNQHANGCSSSTPVPQMLLPQVLLPN